jgi:hypothetical protein
MAHILHFHPFMAKFGGKRDRSREDLVHKGVKSTAIVRLSLTDELWPWYLDMFQIVHILAGTDMWDFIKIGFSCSQTPFTFLRAKCASKMRLCEENLPAYIFENIFWAFSKLNFFWGTCGRKFFRRYFFHHQSGTRSILGLSRFSQIWVRILPEFIDFAILRHF